MVYTVLHFMKDHWLPIALITGVIAALLFIYRNRIQLFFLE
ncbi:hypothetical protein [Paenibacillus gansuensis]|uniref:Uncharacterized protein n=1 Tax=Paenibacillus gansuensis TaxID=306542 RepID=A0ABW5PB51_9BACL